MEQSNSQETFLGLTSQEVEQSRREHGRNVLTPPKRPSIWRLYLDKFSDPVIRVLLIAAVLSFVIAFIENEFAEPIGIVCAIFLATGIGFYFEYDAARKFDALNALGSEEPVRVMRDGKAVEIPRSEIVVGDVIMLDTGDEIPADAELLRAESLQVNESALTGEPVVGKSTNPADFDPAAPYATNQLMRGTTLMEGNATARVIAVGDQTEIGKVAREATALTGEKTPLSRQLDRLAAFINKVGYSVAVLAFIIFTSMSLWKYIPTVGVWDMDSYIHVSKIILQNFMMAVTLIVMAVPEGLPMAVTLSLALNMRRMLKTNNLVRKMHACETMGAITVICTDKTGTLTQNRMTVGEMICADEHCEVLAESIACNSTAFLNEDCTEGLGNPTEVALLLWLHSQGKNYVRLRSEAREIVRTPFSSEKKYMATMVDSPIAGKRMLYVKGAPEIVLDLCTTLTEKEKSDYRVKLQDWQDHARRTLVMVGKEVDDDDTAECETLVSRGGFTLLGLASISDPIREEVPEAIRMCRNAGVQVKIVTGDSSGTATEIARQIGLWTDEDSDRNCIKGVEFAEWTDEEALQRIGDIKVMSRARPLDKQRLVKLLQQKGEVVAVTGDGTNDAPALNFAQVGLAMGSGTSVAKEAGDITLLDDSFRSIVTAVMWGRSLYKNIQRFAMFQLTINFTALFTVLVGSFFGSELPLTVTQMLWVNIIMDSFAALALASLPADVRVMNDKPRPVSQFIITKPIGRSIIGYGIAFVITLLALIAYANADGVFSLHELTLFFTFFVLLQFWNLLNAKAYDTGASAFKGLWNCYGVLLVLALILVGQWLIVEFGGAVFRTQPISGTEWLVLISLSSIVFWWGEVVRFVERLQAK
ncbi:MAG: calcium-translocating P-type ATPase, PMCA-type [Paraprevotella sp.]|nr:calcium-translocating P-type ATPase, PMCA-type [Paraprevotella sp.]